MIFGRTMNPYNRSLTSGGSSGGEGALISLKGSPLGVGTDVGGSVRMPANFCGIYGLRPSYNRLPYAGATNSLEGQDSIPSVVGPLSGSVAGLKALTKAVIDQKPWLKDPEVLRKCWDEDAYKLAEHGRGKNLCFAVMWDDGRTVPHPPIIRVLEYTKNALIAAGHKGLSNIRSSLHGTDLDSDRLAPAQARRTLCVYCMCSVSKNRILLSFIYVYLRVEFGMLAPPKTTKQPLHRQTNLW
jgi:Asp-tRNA(Asn)/Glu-tRNA(Gln) amidotransferase A subunit family amidase